MNKNQKLREALELASRVIHCAIAADILKGDDAQTAFFACRDALAEPVRNCDIGTAEEQEKRWQTNCGHGIPNCKHCKVYEQAKNSGLVHRRYLMSCDCRFIWAQMPYEEVKE